MAGCATAAAPPASSAARPICNSIARNSSPSAISWAASETKEGRNLGAEYLFGTDKSRIAPVELYTRIETAGRSHFQFKGTLYTAP